MTAFTSDLPNLDSTTAT